MIYKLEVLQAPNVTIIRSRLSREVQGTQFGYKSLSLLFKLYTLGMAEQGLFYLLIEADGKQDF